MRWTLPKAGRYKAAHFEKKQIKAWVVEAGCPMQSLTDCKPDSWCKYNLDKAKGKNSYKAGPGIPKDVLLKVRPIYKSLCRFRT